MTTGTRPYTLTIEGFAPDHFRVHTLTGEEAISEAWWFDVVVTGEVGDDVERAALAQRATLVLDVGDEQRAFYGVVAAVRVAEVHAVDRAIKYVVRVVPRLWLLKRKKRSRIFQRMRVTDIASAILLEAGIASRWQLVRAYPEREYCTQYEETDYQFLRRILAEAGIYFFGGGPVDAAALTGDAAVGAAASIGSSVVGFVAGESVGSLVGSAAQMAETLIPGDTIVGADDASCYPPVAGDDPAALAAATAAAMAPAIGDAIGAGSGIAGAVVGTASAIAGTVIADVTGGAASVPVLHFMSNEAARVSTHDKITRFTLRNTVRSSAAAFRDYDPDRPMVRLQSTAVSTQPFPPSPFEIAAQVASTVEDVASAASGLVPGPVGSALGAASDAIATVDSAVNQVAGALGQKVPFEVYEHHSPFLFPQWAFANDEAPRILRQKRRRASIAEGEGGCSDFSPAHRFALHGHPASQLDGAYVVTRVEHRGEVRPTDAETWKVYWNRFECAPAEMTYPPKRPKRKSVQVTLTATVVGPPGEEIHVDERGQIKVQFHWDREGKYDDRSSCWIRTMQPWGGAAWGHQFIPRVGMEVVVVFEGGDPDKPMVLGSLYNGTHPPPFKLPEHKTRSGIRTQSTPGGSSFYVRGDHFLTASGILKASADGALVLQCGESRIEISPKAIKISAASVSLAGSESTSIEGKGPSLKLGESAELVAEKLVVSTPDASLKLDGDASLRGKRVLLNSDELDRPGRSGQDPPPDETRSFKLAVKDPELEPYKDKRYALLVDGVTREGTTTADGMIDEKIPADAKRAALVVWIDKYPTGRKLEYHVDLRDLPPSTSIEGAQERLKNLGYYGGEPTGKADEQARDAVKWFQRDHDLDPTGELDGPTLAAIEKAHGH